MAAGLSAAMLAQGLPVPGAPLPGSGTAQVYGRSTEADTVGPGDVLDVRVFDQPQLSDELRVGPDGRINPPFLAPLLVAGKTSAQVETQLSRAWAGMLVHPLVSVRLIEINSRKVAVNGEVARPGLYAYSGQITLLEALALAGGIDPVKASPQVFLLHAGVAPVTPGANGQPAQISVNSVLETIDTSQLMRHPELNRVLSPGDVIDVPEARHVYLTGDVMHPGNQPLRPGLTVTQAVSTAGGLLPQADHSRVRILRTQPNSTSRQEIVVNVGAIQSNRAPDVPLEADDIVIAAGSLMRMTGLELLDFFTGTERWRVQQTVANEVP